MTLNWDDVLDDLILPADDDPADDDDGTVRVISVVTTLHKPGCAVDIRTDLDADDRAVLAVLIALQRAVRGRTDLQDLAIAAIDNDNATAREIAG